MKKDMQWKTFALEAVKAEGDEEHRTIAGRANVYGIMDEVGDIVEAGAFARSLSNDDVRPLLWQHRADEIIGDGVFEEAGNALMLVDGKLFEGVQRAEEAYRIAKQSRRPLGLSIGFSIPKGGAQTDEEGIRHITEARLHEVSLVTFPANTQSYITGVKSAEDNLAALRELLADDPDALTKAIEELTALLPEPEAPSDDEPEKSIPQEEVDAMMAKARSLVP